MTPLARALGASGFEVVKAPTGKEAIRLLGSAHFDLVLSDADLPDISGFEICRRLKRDPERRQLPVIIMSGGLEQDIERLALSAGATDFISKPFKREALLEKISSLNGAEIHLERK